MDVIAVAEPAGSFRPCSRRATIATASVLAAAVFLWMRAGANLPTPQFQGVCERLREAGLAITSKDVFCHPMPWTSRAAYVVASLLIAVGFVLPGVILAASGRRLTAFLPLLVAPAVRYPQDLLFVTRSWASTTWPRGPVASTVATMMVMALPVGAVTYAKRGSRVSHVRPSLVAGIASALACGAGVVAAVFIAQGVLARHLGGTGGEVGVAGIVPPAIAIAVFGMLLGPDRRWWPWSLVPAAFLLSAGPSYALIIGPQRVLDWSNFGIVAPLFAAGLVSSAWRPLAAGLSRLFPDEEEAWEASSTPRSERVHSDPGRVRPVVVLNAVAAGLLAVSLIVFRADPLPVQYATSLPTYLGARVSIQDLRTRLDLRRAMVAMDAYRASHGTYRGFDAASGTTADPSLEWIDGPPTQPFGGSDHTIVAIVTSTDAEARIVAVSGSGNGFCLQRTGGGHLSYGRGTRFGASDPGVNVIEAAMAACGSTPWSAAAIRRFPFSTMCQDVEPDQYLICRVVQALITTTMKGAERV
ncbi:MAG: hypothetical protein ACRDH7_06780 [Actinomycetota bacterium]